MKPNLPEPERKGFDPFRLIPAIFILFAGLMMYANRPSSYSYAPLQPLPPTPKITHIPADDPAVIAFGKFAKTNKLEWDITIGWSGESYCASAHAPWSSRPPLFNGADCRSTLQEATASVVEQWSRRDVRVGSEQK